MSNCSSKCKTTQIRTSIMTEGIKKKKVKLRCSVLDLTSSWNVPTVGALAGDSGWRVLSWIWRLLGGV